jgi:hypothetical protein
MAGQPVAELPVAVLPDPPVGSTPESQSRHLLSCTSTSNERTPVVSSPVWPSVAVQPTVTFVDADGFGTDENDAVGAVRSIAPPVRRWFCLKVGQSKRPCGTLAIFHAMRRSRSPVSRWPFPFAS